MATALTTAPLSEAQIEESRLGVRGTRGGSTRVRAATTAFFVGPALLAIVVMTAIPIAYNVYISFTNRSLRQLTSFEFIGLNNYRALLGGLSTDFFVVVARTYLWVAVCITAFVVVGTSLALILNEPGLRGRALYRTLLIVPWAIPGWLAGLVWKFFFHGQFGIINQTLHVVGLPGVPWLTQPEPAFVAVVTANLWLSYPFFMIVVLAGLQSIPRELYEAAAVDGAGYFSRLRSITLPLLRPAVLPAAILSAITTFQNFDMVWLMTKGGPFGSARVGATEFVMLYARRQAFELFNFGYIAAFAVIIFALILTMTVLNARITQVARSAFE
jgi:arabinogalactan oligomer/maltooligosaccharide transport system permease protein